MYIILFVDKSYILKNIKIINYLEKRLIMYITQWTWLKRVKEKLFKNFICKALLTKKNWQEMCIQRNKGIEKVKYIMWIDIWEIKSGY
jgi:hypothetical protein